MNKKNYFLKNYKEINNHSKKSQTNLKSNGLYFEKLESEQKVVHPEFSKKKITAIYFILLGIEDASNIMKHLQEKEIAAIIGEILKIKKIYSEDIAEVNKYFGSIDNKSLEKVNGKEFSRELLQKSFGIDKGSKFFIKCIEEEKKEAKSLKFIEKLEPKNIADILLKESNTVNVIILGMMEPKTAANVLKFFPKEKSVDILKKISKKIEINPEIFETIVKKLKDKVSKQSNNESLELPGKEKLIEILKYSNYDKSLSIIESLENISPDLAEELREKIFTFNDIINIPKKSLDSILKDFSDENIAFILKGASDEIKNVFFKSITKKRREIIKEEIDFLGMVKKKDVDEKRREFIEYIRSLEKEGKIVLNPDNEVYVE